MVLWQSRDGEKQGKLQKNKLVRGKKKGIWKFCLNTGKTQGILFAQVVIFLTLKVQDIAIFAVKISISFSETESYAKSVFVYVIVTNHVN